MKIPNFVTPCLGFVLSLAPGFSLPPNEEPEPAANPVLALPSWLLPLHRKPGMSLFTIPRLSSAVSLSIADDVLSEYPAVFSYSGRHGGTLSLWGRLQSSHNLLRSPSNSEGQPGEDFAGAANFNMSLSDENVRVIDQRLGEWCRSFILQHPEIVHEASVDELRQSTCVTAFKTFVVEELEMQIWLKRNELRQHQYTFDPFFATSGNFKTFNKYFLEPYSNPSGPLPLLLDLSQPLLLLEVGSFEGSSAAWIAESLLIHPSSLLICVDAWAAKWTALEQETNNNAYINKMQNALGGGTALKNFVHNMERTPNGDQVVGLRADSTMQALTALLYSQSPPPLCTDADCVVGVDGIDFGYKEESSSSKQSLMTPPPVLFQFDFVYIDAGHSASDVLTDAILSFHLLKVGGVIVFDDYSYAEDTKFAVDTFIKAFDKELRIVFKDYIVIALKVNH